MKPLKKFVTIGPESTGKSTLCEILAHHYDTLWCKEYAREYLSSLGRTYTYEDLLIIAKGQITAEETAAKETLCKGKGLLFVDTGMNVMKVWCEYVYGKCYQFILDSIAERKYDGYFLCYPDLPWEADALREYPDETIRKELFHYYSEIISSQNVPWSLISGTYEQRTKKAVSFVNQISGY